MKKILVILLSVVMLSACSSKTEDQFVVETHDPIVVELNENNFWEYFYVAKETKERHDDFGNLINAYDFLVFKSKMFKQDYIMINVEDFAIAISFMDPTSARERLLSTNIMTHFLADNFIGLFNPYEADSFKNDILKLQVKGTITFDKKEYHDFEINDECRWLDGFEDCVSGAQEY